MTVEELCNRLTDATQEETELLKFVIQQHDGQVRKYTGEPYAVHVISVANMVKLYGGDMMQVAAALCHDLFEDTECDKMQLIVALRFAGYNTIQSWNIIELVQDLTDCYSSEAFPTRNREWRKNKEAERLGKVSHRAQTIKYCDLLDNTSSIVEHDAKFAQVYLREKQNILSKMDKGHPELLERVKWQITVHQETAI